jgi:hypothetical protein
LNYIKLYDCKIAVVSNATSIFSANVLHHIGVSEKINRFVGPNEKNIPKPSCNMFLDIMREFDVGARETIIIEDSTPGKLAAYNSGANVLNVENSDDFYASQVRIMNFISIIAECDKIPYFNHKLNILIPMAGKGSRFVEKGYSLPKPLIDVFGQPMIKEVIKSTNCIGGKLIFLVLKEHVEKYNLDIFFRNVSRM